MKKLIFILIAFALLIPACFAEQAPVSGKPSAQAQMETKSITGKIESITVADTAKSIKNEIVIVEENGTKMSFGVSNSVVVHDTASAVISFDKLAKDQKVQVDYHVNKAGVNKVTAITLVK